MSEKTVAVFETIAGIEGDILKTLKLYVSNSSLTINLFISSYTAFGNRDLRETAQKKAVTELYSLESNNPSPQAMIFYSIEEDFLGFYTNKTQLDPAKMAEVQYYLEKMSDQLKAGFKPADMLRRIIGYISCKVVKDFPRGDKAPEPKVILLK